MSHERAKPRWGAKKRWWNLDGEMHPLLALAIVFLLFLGIPLLAKMLEPWTGALFRMIFG